MRIIGGKFRGKKIFLPKDKNTRPLRDLVKESIFNLISHSKKFHCSLVNSNILDLFSGIGSFGLECISRNCKKVTFFENYSEALYILEKNLNLLNVKSNHEIIKKDCFKFFNDEEIFNEKYDIIFLDPPYKENRVNFLINIILDKKILKMGLLLSINIKKIILSKIVSSKF